MMGKSPRAIGIFLVTAIFLGGCAGLGPVLTKGEAYPLMYSDIKPVSVVVVPAVNKTTAADAADLINVTLTQPFANRGYYVLPIAIASEIFKQEGVIEGEQVFNFPVSVFKSNFGADSVLYVTINSWDKSYYVIGGKVTVGMSYVLVSTETSDVLWTAKKEFVVDTGGDAGGGLLGAVISTAINTATTDYLPIARQVNALAVASLPVGQYHPNSGSDAEDRAVLESQKDVALEDHQ